MVFRVILSINQLINRFAYINIIKMGCSSGVGDSHHHHIEPESLRASIEQNLSENRLRLDHQTNIFAKCEYLHSHYDEYISKFEEMYLTHNMLSIQLMNLLGKMNLTNLKTLSLSNNDIADESLKPIKDMPLKGLQYLFLDHNFIADDGCYYFTRTNLQSLLTLDLSNNRISDEGCKHLAKATLPNLRTLLINNNKFREKGLMYLSKGQWPLLAFAQAKQNQFEPNKQLESTKFRSQVKAFRLQIQ